MLLENALHLHERKKKGDDSSLWSINAENDDAGVDASRVYVIKQAQIETKAD